MATLEMVLSAGVLVLAIAFTLVTLLLLRERSDDSDEIDTDQLTAAMGRTLNDLGLQDTVAEVGKHAEVMKETHQSLESMLRHPGDRGGFGEIQLETILSDYLPSDMFGTQERVVDNLQPDAYIQSTEGIICIDSKFPLRNFRNFLEASDNGEKMEHLDGFRENVEDHLNKVGAKYVRPAEGTAPFAFVFVPSESVYHHLITEEQDLLREYVRSGVQVVSPLTMGQKMELIRTGVHAQRMSEKAVEIQEKLNRLAERFDNVMGVWSTFYGTHFSNAVSRVSDVDGELKQLHREFQSISRLEADEVEVQE